MKSLDSLTTSQIAILAHAAEAHFQASIGKMKLFTIMCLFLFSFGLSAQTPTVIKLSELTAVVTPIKLGGSLMIGGLLLNPEKPIVTDSTYSCIWKSGETTVMMEFNRNCKECPASPIYYSDSKSSRVWLNSNDGKSWGEITAKSVSLESNYPPLFPYSQKFNCQSMAVGEGDGYLNTTKGKLLKDKLQIVFRGNENFVIQNDGGEGNLYWTSENCDVLTIDGKIVNVTFFNRNGGWTKYFSK